MAATQVGTLVAAKVRDLSRGNNELEAKLFSNNTWQDIGTRPWLTHRSASYRQFGLTRIGINAPLRIRDVRGIRIID